MALSSIITNVAAYSAQRNIGYANDSASSSIARLSSGNRIVQAKDDVAALATGTSLRTSVTTLKQALLNTSQGASLLQIADGALGQVVDILQRQKALSVQAGSGSLSDTDRAFLNQEFQALSDEINRIATSTKFSSVNLLNGTLSGASVVNVNTTQGVATNNQTAANSITIAGAPANNSYITVNGMQVTFTTSALGSADAAGKVVIGAAAAQTAANLARFLNESTDARLQNYQFIANAANIVVAWGGGQLSAPHVVDIGAGTSTNVTIGTAANRTIATGTTADGLSVNSVKAQGSVTGSILATGGTTAALAGNALTTYFTGANQGISNNADFIGKLGEGKMGKIEATFTAASTAVFRLEVGDYIYTSAATNVVNAATVAVRLTGTNKLTGAAGGGSFQFIVAGGAVAAADAADQSDFNNLASMINDSLKNVTFTQNRDITTFQEGSVVTVGGTQVANFNNIRANYVSDDFSNVKIEDIQITAPDATSTDAKITVKINGETYTSFAGLGSTIKTNTNISLQNVKDPNKSFNIMTGNVAITGTTSINLSTQENADAVAKALKEAFGIAEGSAAISFQVGNSSAESLGVRIDSVETKFIYGGQTLDISTQAGASAAGSVIDSAINTVISIRADVGALQSRFDFASSNLQVTIQNQDAARGVLLDTDVTAESTKYATAQVQLQAGIAVLAQANLIPQNLLKLIG